jgi:hypothetical protein
MGVTLTRKQLPKNKHRNRHDKNPRGHPPNTPNIEQINPRIARAPISFGLDVVFCDLLARGALRVARRRFVDVLLGREVPVCGRQVEGRDVAA